MKLKLEPIFKENLNAMKINFYLKIAYHREFNLNFKIKYEDFSLDEPEDMEQTLTSRD